MQDPIALLIEPRVTFAGKGYPAGYSGSSGTHVGYVGTTYRTVCERARTLLAGADIINQGWQHALAQLGTTDFAYVDPPYYGTAASYPNIDHAALIDCLNAARFHWALSGYTNTLYEQQLKFVRHYTKERNSELKSSKSGHYEGVVEHLWTNY
jgi:site-specific DNA-adenine methylase